MRHHGDRRHGVDGIAVLIKCRPFYADYSLPFRFRWCEIDYFALDVDHIARAYRGEPPQFIDAEQDLKGGAEVAGATPSNPEPVLSVRTR